jgi:hypothetical protein
VIVDYLTATFPGSVGRDHLGELAHYLDPGCVELENDRGFLIGGDGRLLYAVEGRAARLSLGGSALGVLRESGSVSFPELVRRVWSFDGSITRVDWAFDFDVPAEPVIDRLKDAIKAGEYTSRWRLDGSRSCVDISSVLGAGRTLSFGSPASDFRLRVYDKAAERGLDDRDWLRFEFQCRKERADEFVRLALDADDPVSFVRSVLLGYLDVKRAGVDSNKRRWDTADWWLSLWGDVKVRVTLGSEIVALDRVIAWVDRISPSLALVADAAGGRDPMGWWDQWYFNGRSRYKRSSVHLARAGVWGVNGHGADTVPAGRP